MKKKLQVLIHISKSLSIKSLFCLILAVFTMKLKVVIRYRFSECLSKWNVWKVKINFLFILSIIKHSPSDQQTEGFGVMSEPDDGLERVVEELPSRFDIFDPTQGIENEAKALTEGDLFSIWFSSTLYAIREELATLGSPKSWRCQKLLQFQPRLGKSPLLARILVENRFGLWEIFVPPEWPTLQTRAPQISLIMKLFDY